MTAVTILIALLYLGFSALMLITEKQWLGEAPFHEATDVVSESTHEIALIDQGATSLAVRLALIESATASLDLEFFIFEVDTASRLVSQALVAKARSGVRVRVLVDFALPVFKLRPAYARELAAAGIEVRYYNTASVARFFSVQHRTHRKLLLVDGVTAMVGGRNIGNDYFDLSEHYNFLDSDAVIRGEVVSAIGDSFDLYWNSSWTVLPGSVEQDDGDTALASALLAQRPGDRAIRTRLGEVDTALQAHDCPKVRFVTDYPGAGGHNRRVFEAITQVLAGARTQVLAESPYFVLRPDGVGVVRSLTERGVAVTVLTNSLHSTDAYYTVSPLYFGLAEVADTGIALHAYGGAPPEQLPVFQGSQRWGVHSKRAVVDDDTIIIGTYNVDPRSANLNSELVVVCEGNTTLAARMRADIEDRIARSEPVIGEAGVESGHLIGAAPWRSVLMMVVVAPVAGLFDFLL